LNLLIRSGEINHRLVFQRHLREAPRAATGRNRNTAGS
jgi:hypothetical protein